MKRGVSGSGLSFFSKGEGRPLIFIHGWAMAASVWERQVDYFGGRGFEAVAVDMRGHGESVKEGPYTIAQFAYDLKGFVHEMGYDRPILVGWSMGAMVVIEYIARHPHSAGRLCLVGGTPRFTSGDDYPHGLPPKELTGMKVKLKRDFLRCLGEFRESITGGVGEAEKSLITDAAIPSPDAAKAGLKELADVDLRSSLEKIKVPVLIIHGDRDRVCPPGAAACMEEGIRGAELLMMPEAGHVPFLSDAGLFNSRLEEFSGRE